MLGEVDFVKVGFNAVETELQALGQQTMRRILSVYRIPPPFAGDYEKMNYSNAEHAGQSFLTYTLLPHLKQFQGEVLLKCLSPAERVTLYPEFLVDDLVRAEFEKRMKGYALEILHGIASPNEVRARENLPPYEGGDQFRLPLNTENASLLKEKDDA